VGGIKMMFQFRCAEIIAGARCSALISVDQIPDVLTVNWSIEESSDGERCFYCRSHTAMRERARVVPASAPLPAISLHEPSTRPPERPSTDEIVKARLKFEMINAAILGKL
jgi:hypothetical protein